LIRYTRDEVYIVASGTGVFVAPDRRKPFKPTDFVPAGVEHRFRGLLRRFRDAGRCSMGSKAAKTLPWFGIGILSKVYRRSVA
jgi:hypothetical protein